MIAKQRFSTALRDHVRKRIEQLGYADIVVGVPCYHSGATIQHVVKTILTGLEKHYRDYKAVVMISDGGSTDDTRDLARAIEANSYNIEKIVTVYRGVPGKGSGLRAVFEVAQFLKAKAVAVFDSDLISITPEWVRNTLEPIFQGYDYAAPDYNRYKFDGTITNTIAYNLTRTLYGYRIRQPIGGGLRPVPPSDQVLPRPGRLGIGRREVRNRYLDDHHGRRRRFQYLPVEVGGEDPRRKRPFGRPGPHVPPGRGHHVPAHGAL